MELFVSLAVIVLLSFFAIRQIIRNLRGNSPGVERVRIMPVLFLTCVFMLATACLDPESCNEQGQTGLLAALLGVMPYSFTLFPVKRQKCISILAALGETSAGIMNIIYSNAWIRSSWTTYLQVSSLMLSCVIAALFVYGIVWHLRILKDVMKMGTVWTVVSVCVDAVYVVFLLTMTLVFQMTQCHLLYMLFLAALLCASFCRSADSVVFIFWRTHEKRILESMRTTHQESGGDGPGVDILYRNIYEKVLEYFDKQTPYLNNALTINDIVPIVLSNKLYISRAISRYTGRNFCQFVNYYRVTYAVELFRSNPELKIVEMASSSGFNSSVSFSMAFRLFMGEKPGDWCRKERRKLAKNKK